MEGTLHVDVTRVFLRDFYIQKQFWSFENNLGVSKTI